MCQGLRLRTLGVVLISLFLMGVGCPKNFKPGHYEGTLLKYKDRDASKTDSDGESIEDSEITVGMEVKVVDKKVTIDVMNENEKFLFQIEIQKPKKHQISVLIPKFEETEFILDRVEFENKLEEYKCFVRRGEVSLEVCYNDMEFFLKLDNAEKKYAFKLSGHSFHQRIPKPLEVPLRYTLSGAISHALEHNFEVQIQFLHALSAKSAALAAWLQLIPHLNSNLIWNAQPSFVPYIATVEALAPFLLPSYWFDAKEATINVKAERIAYRIMQADLAASVEQLTYAYERDRKISVAHQNVVKELDLIETKTRFEKGKAPNFEKKIHDLRNLRALVLKTKSGVDRVLTEDLSALAQLLGLQNPDGVKGIEIGHEISPLSRNRKPLKKYTLARNALRRSFELQQMDYLMSITKLKNIEMYFVFLDPSGDPKMGMGFNLIGQVKVASGNVEELKQKQDYTEAKIRQNAFRVVRDYNESLEKAFPNAGDLPSEDPDLREKMRSLLTEGYEKNEFNPEKIKDGIQKYLAKVVDDESNLAAFRTARSKRDRLLLAGYYRKLLPELPSLNPQVELQTPVNP